MDEDRRARRWPSRAALAALLLAAPLLAGCTGSGDWTKPGAGAAETAAAVQACRSVADRAVGPEEGIDQDIMTTRQTDWGRSQIGGLARAELGAETRGRADRIVASCLRARGFVQPR
jgi:hypothetical protein